MTSNFTFRASALAVAALTLPLFFGSAYAAPLSKDELKMGKERVTTAYNAGQAGCKMLAGNARDICKEEAKGKANVARAELQYSYSEKPKDLTKVGEAKANATYEIAKERCDDLAGNDKSVCRKEARAVMVKALVDVRSTGEINATTAEGKQMKLDADYKVAAEQCEMLAGAAKADCMTSAKNRFGKT
jgi:hypothetical protein